MHMSPALVGWAVHWYPNQVRVPIDSWPAAQQEEWYTGTFFQLVILPMGPYLLWSVTYYLKIFVISREKVQQENYATLFKYMTKNKKALAARIVLRASPAYQVIPPSPAPLSLHLLFPLLFLLLYRCCPTPYPPSSPFSILLSLLRLMSLPLSPGRHGNGQHGNRLLMHPVLVLEPERRICRDTRILSALQLFPPSNLLNILDGSV